MRLHIVRAAVLLAALIFGGSEVLPNDIYQNGFPNENTFFPLGVWLQSPTRASRFKEMGINMFVGLWEGPTEAQLAEIRDGYAEVLDEQRNVQISEGSFNSFAGYGVHLYRIPMDQHG
jgi:hypothetical protein